MQRKTKKETEADDGSSPSPRGSFLASNAPLPRPFLLEGLYVYHEGGVGVVSNAAQGAAGGKEVFRKMHLSSFSFGKRGFEKEPEACAPRRRLARRFTSLNCDPGMPVMVSCAPAPAEGSREAAQRGLGGRD
jgi:hypothetical protein